MNPITAIGTAFRSIVGLTKTITLPHVIGGQDLLTTFLSDSAWSSGKHLTTYKKSLYVFACVSKIAQKVASTEFQLFRIKNLQGDKEQVFVHPVLDLMYKPNPFQTKAQFFKLYMINKKLTGSAFVLKVRNASGKVVELWNLRPDFMRIILDEKEIIKGFEFSGNGKTVLFAPTDIIFDNEPDPLVDFGGMSPLQPAQARVDVEEFATKYQRNFYLNNARPDFLLLAEKKVSAEQKADIRESWDKRHRAGKDQKNVGKMGILDGGLTFQQVSLDQKSMEHLENLKMTRDDILVAYATPKPIISITEDVNYANSKTAMQIYLEETIVPENRSLVEVFNEGMVYEDFEPTLYLDFISPVKEDEAAKADIQTKRIASGTLLINEAREQWGDDPVRGGNLLYMPLNMQPVGGLPSEGGEKGLAVAIGAKDGESPYTAVRAKDRVIMAHFPKAVRHLKRVARIEKMLWKDIRDGIRAEARAKAALKAGIGLVKDTQKAVYLESTLKAIDKRGDAMEPALNTLAKEQATRVLKALGFKRSKSVNYNVKGKDVEESLRAWAVAEVGIVTEFSLPFVEEFIREAGEEAMRLVDPADDFSMTAPEVTKFIKARAKFMARSTTVTTLEELSETLGAGIDAGEGVALLVNRIDEVFSDFPLFRSRMIARTEATAANNKGFIEAYRQSGVANAKEWIATLDGKTRDSHSGLNGKIVGLDEEFSNGLMFPGDSSGGADEVINCRCVLAPAFRE